jgi:hypothetical protein
MEVAKLITNHVTNAASAGSYLPDLRGLSILARQPAPGLRLALCPQHRNSREGRHNCNCSRQKVALLGPCDRELDWVAMWGKSTPICVASMQRGRALSCRSRLPRDRSNDLLIVAIARHPPLEVQVGLGG